MTETFDPDSLAAVRSMWRYYGQQRPSFAHPAADGQESVWDYPRPPRLESDGREVRVRVGAVELARSQRAVRVLETASPPTFYLPPQDVRIEHLAPAPGGSMCEWKGRAGYWSLRLEGVSRQAVAWSYEQPLPGFEALRGFIAFYPGRVDCLVDGVVVEPQPGLFYGGWITPEIVGPYKGEPGSTAW